MNNEKRKIIDAHPDTLIHESTEHIKLLDELKTKSERTKKMFSKTDFTEFIDQITSVENTMIENIDALSGYISGYTKEENILALLDKIREDEEKHVLILAEIGDIINQQPDE